MVGIGSTHRFDILVYAQWQDEGNVWASFPVQNPASNNGAETFTHALARRETSATRPPQQLPIIESGGVEKVDNALNLAIVFHQHQPYYKNKLTGMYEMPWVRVRHDRACGFSGYLGGHRHQACRKAMKSWVGSIRQALATRNSTT